MADFAYHQEALRKARIIERKNAAQSACSSRQNGNNDRQCNGDWGSASPQKMNYRDSHRYCKPARVEQGSGYDRITMPQDVRQTCSAVHSGIYRDLKQQEKTLRDHNLVMGPMDAFKDYYRTNNYHAHKSTLSHY